jgi:hypothetical protein
VTIYSDLADTLSHRRTHARHDRAQAAVRGINAAQVYEHVKLLVGDEIDKANAELRKRRLATIERVFLPSFQGKLCLTYGSDLLCTVELQKDKGQIAAVISGPPNATEISRKEFVIDGAMSPEQITVAIVSGLLMGEFT